MFGRSKKIMAFNLAIFEKAILGNTESTITNQKIKTNRMQFFSKIKFIVEKTCLFTIFDKKKYRTIHYTIMSICSARFFLCKSS